MTDLLAPVRAALNWLRDGSESDSVAADGLEAALPALEEALARLDELEQDLAEWLDHEEARDAD